MMTFLVTLLLTFSLVAVALVVFWKIGSPFYRVERENVIALLELILAERATEADWEVFAGYPIRQDEELSRVQRTCLEIAESEYVGGQGALFTPRGMSQLRSVLTQLREDLPAQR